MSGGWDSPGAPICAGYRRPAHEARNVGSDHLCHACQSRRDSDAEKAELGHAAGWDDDTRREATGA